MLSLMLNAHDPAGTSIGTFEVPGARRERRINPIPPGAFTRDQRSGPEVSRV
ncbi:MAG: hypothetical protein M0R03_01980 [Novosphingobium sp.]|nr:hypothetical protein [Novosphingobium sp.]